MTTPNDENPKALEAEVLSVHEIAQLKSGAAAIIVEAKTIAESVKDEQSKIAAEQWAVKRSGEIKQIEEKYKRIKDRMNAAHALVCEAEHDEVDPRKEGKKIIGEACSAYVALANQKLREDEERLSKEAKTTQDDHALRVAEHLEASGEKDAAKAILDHSSAIPTAPISIRKEESAKGVSYRTVYDDFQIIDLGALIKAAGEQLELRSLLKADEVAIRRRLISMKGLANIPGVRVRPPYLSQITRAQKIA